MRGPDLANDGLFFLICLLTVLLVMFIVQVIRTPLELAEATEQPVLNLPEPPPPAPAAPAPPPALPVRRPPVPAFPAAPGAMNGQPVNGGYTARHASAYVPVDSWPKVTGGPPWDPAPRPPDVDGRESLSPFGLVYGMLAGLLVHAASTGQRPRPAAVM
jgi:hypothetical protein